MVYITFCLVCQDEARVHKVTKRIHTLEEVNINVKLLTEMLSHYNKESSTDSDKEIIKVCVHTQNPHTREWGAKVVLFDKIKKETVRIFEIPKYSPLHSA